MSFRKGLGIIAAIGIGNAILFSGIPAWALASAPAILFVTIYLAIKIAISPQTKPKKWTVK